MSCLKIHIDVGDNLVLGDMVNDSISDGSTTTAADEAKCKFLGNRPSIIIVASGTTTASNSCRLTETVQMGCRGVLFSTPTNKGFVCVAANNWWLLHGVGGGFRCDVGCGVGGVTHTLLLPEAT